MKRRKFVIEIELEDRTIWQGVDAYGLKRRLEDSAFKGDARVYECTVTEVE